MSDFNFTCPACGQNILCDISQEGMTMNCPSCKASVTVPKLPPLPPLPPMPSQLASPPHPGSSAPNVTRMSALAITSLICSLTCIGSLPGIIFGHCARAAIRRNPSLEGKGIAMAGLIVGYTIMVLTVCGGIYTGSFFYKQAKEVKQLLQDAEQDATSTNDSTMATNDSNIVDSLKVISPYEKPAWTLDLSNVNFPDHPVSGPFHGQDFVTTKSVLQKGDIKFSSDGGMQISIHGLKSIEGKEFNFQPPTADEEPSIHIRWMDENGESKTKVFKTGYALKLKFGNARKRKVHGEIYLCLPDDSKSCVAGKFEVTMPKKK